MKMEPPTTPHNRLKTRPESASYLHISQRKFDQLIANEDIPCVRIGSCVRVDQDDLDAYVAAQKSV